MTKDEMLELLGDMDPQYVLEAQRLRSGQMKTHSGGAWLRRTAAVAAMLAVVTVAGAFLKPYLAASWVKPSAEEDWREDTRTITYYLNGQEMQTEATLFEAEEFSIYIFPDWVHETITYGSNQAHRWTKGASSLTVLYRPEENMAMVREWIRLRELGSGLAESASGSMKSGTMYVYFTEVSGGCLVQILEFPQGDGNDSVRTMDAMRDTLLPAEEIPKSFDTRPEVVYYSLPDETFEYQSVAFTLYQGDGWSTYIPEDGGWEQVNPDYLKIETPRVEAVLCLQNGENRFTVIRMENATRDEAVNWVSEAYPAHGWDWEWDFSGLSCTGGSDMRLVKKRFVQYQDGYYAVISDWRMGLTERYVRIMDAEFQTEAS